MQVETLQDLASRIDPIPGFDRGLFRIGGTDVTVASLVSFFVFLLLAFVASALIQRGLRRVYTRRSIETGVQYALNRLVHYVIIAVGVFLALENLGISLTALAGLGAILAVGIGFGLQNITQNFVSGLILLMERPVKKGDYVEVGEVRGTVREIHARATLITTLDNVDVLVPNGDLITQQVVNQTFDDRRIRTRVEVGVAYGSDTDLVRRVLERVAEEHESVLADPAPKVWFAAFGESSLEFALLVWVPEALVQGQITSDLRFAIDRAFREEGIAIPFPQRDLHLKSGWEARASAPV